MDRWKRFKEDKLPDKESFYSELNKEHISDSDYEHAKNVFNKCKNLGKYHGLYVQMNTAQLADVFENLEIHVQKNINLILLTFSLLLD